MNGLPIFRIFDLAFFLPGLMVVAAAMVIELIDLRVYTSASVTNLEGVLTVTALIGACYLIGLLLHVVYEPCGRVGYFLWEKINRKGARSIKPWYQELDAGTRSELVLYFWYMRGTCRNVACTFFLIAIGVVIKLGLSWLLAGLLIAGLLSSFLALEFTIAHRRSVE